MRMHLRTKNNQIIFLLLLIVLSCTSQELKNEWVAKPFIDAYGKENGVKLEIQGEFLTGDMKTASINFSNIEDLISGGYKEVFTLAFGNYSGSDSVTVTTAEGDLEVFNCYDGLIFDIDYETDDINRLLEMMDSPSLTISQGNRSFRISTKGFQELYEKHFVSPEIVM
jgi:hypothetical protein